MPTTINLQGTVLYGAIPLWILFFILISPWIRKKIEKKRKRKAAKNEVDRQDNLSIKKVPLSVKERYVEQLNNILKEYKSGIRGEKDSYQLLSFFLREFFNEYVGIDVTKKTLAEIRGIHNSRLEKLIEEFYECEFAKDAKGDVESAIKRTIRSIENW